MFDFLLCGFNLTCQYDTLKYHFGGPKYPPDVATICYYFEEQKAELPEYCKWETNTQPPRRRSEF